MIKLSIDKMELPEWDVVKATPILVFLGSGKELIFEIPSVEKYFDFEAMYLKFILANFLLFKDVNFLEYKEFAEKDLVQKILAEFHRAMQIENTKRDFLKILKGYFKANFNINKIMKYINPMQLAYLFLLCHKVVETVKKKFAQTVDAIIPEALPQYSTYLNSSLRKVEPRY